MKKIFYIVGLIIVFLVIAKLTGEAEKSINIHQNDATEVVTEDENGGESARTARTIRKDARD